MKWVAIVVLRGPEGAHDDYYSTLVGLHPDSRQMPLGTRDFVLEVNQRWGVTYQMLAPPREPAPKRRWIRRLWEWVREL